MRIPHIILFITFFSCIIISAEPLTVTLPPSIQFTAGSHEQLQLLFEPTEPLDITLSSSVSPSDEGFTIEFSQSTFTIDTTTTITAYINTSIELSPDTYTIDIFYTYSPTEKKSKPHSNTIIITTEPSSPSNPTPPDNTPNDTDNTNSTNTTNSTIVSIPLPIESSIDYSYIIYLPIMFILSIIYIFVIKKKKRQDE